LPKAADENDDSGNCQISNFLDTMKVQQKLKSFRNTNKSIRIKIFLEIQKKA
jgi:hypothetical protein